MRLDGALSVCALDAALSEVLRRHEALRTVFLEKNGSFVPEVSPAGGIVTRILDFEGLADPQVALEETTWRNANRPIDPRKDPVFRLALARGNQTDHVLLLAVHHIAADAWSMRILIDEIERLYSAFVSGGPLSLPELRLTYSDYARWQRRLLAARTLEDDLSYWSATLRGFERLRFPADRPHLLASSAVVATRRYLFPAETKESLHTLAIQEGTTTFVALLSAFALLLSRYTGQADIAINTPASLRDRDGTEAIIGLFVNVLVIRIVLSPEDTFRQLLAKARRVCLDAYAHRNAPFLKVMERLRTDGNEVGRALEEVKLTLEGGGARLLRLPGLDATIETIEAGSPKVELGFDLLETPRGIEGFVSYDAARFDSVTIDRIWSHLARLTTAVFESPDRCALDAPMLSAAELHQILSEFNDTSTVYETDKCVHEIFAANAVNAPDRIAVWFEDRALSYRELNQRANRAARYLESLGVGTGLIVGIFLERSEEVVIAFLAVLKAGAAFLPMDTSYPVERLAFMMEDAQIQIAITDEKLSGLLPASIGYPVFIEAAITYMEEGATEFSPAAMDSENLAYAIYTSGSTGQPKAAAVEHRSVANLVLGGIKEFGLEQGAVILCIASFSFDISMIELFTPLVVGGTLLLASYAERLDPGRLVSIFRELDWVTSVPSIMRIVIDAMTADGIEAIHGSKDICVGGEAIPGSLLAALKERFPEARLSVLYGPTETTVLSTRYSLREPLAEDPHLERHMIGRPLPNTRIQICDGNGELVPIGVPGEILIGGQGVARGYLNREELTSSRFVHIRNERFYKTGDIGRWLVSGDIEFLGRTDHQIKVKGYRIEPGEIESHIASFPGVKEAVVVAVRDTGQEQKLAAYLVTREKCEFREDLLRAHLEQLLPPFMLPDAIVQLERMPLNINGKFDRKALPSIEQRTPAAAAAAPGSETELTLANIWRDVLGRDPGIYDNFFDAGGDSILAIQIAARAAKKGLSLTVGQILKHQTIANLASVAGAAASRGRTKFTAGPVPLTPIQRWFFEHDFADRRHWNMSLLLELREWVEPAVITLAMECVAANHQALHTRFRQTASGWIQISEAPTVASIVAMIDLSSIAVDRQPELIDAITRDSQTSLDLEAGPLFRFLLLLPGVDAAPRLLMIVHHLVIDGLSWRILLEDLHSCYARLRDGRPIDAQPDYPSLKEWAEALSCHAISANSLNAEVDFWLSQSETDTQALAFGSARGPNVEEFTAMVTSSLSQDETLRLLGIGRAAHHSTAHEVLVAALVTVMSEWTGRDSLTIWIEGHGREELGEPIDISRTVGWFTSLYPVRFLIERNAPPDRVLESVTEHLRRIPNRGIGYGLLRYLSGDPVIESRLATQPFTSVIFNYLGVLSHDLESASVFSRIEPLPHARSESARRPALLEINCFITGGKLLVEWRYSRRVHERQTIESLADALVDSVRGFVRGASISDSSALDPSGFRLSKLTAEELRGLRRRRPDLEDAYPLSHTQSGILYHCIRDPHPAIYVQQSRLRIDGDLDQESFHSAWRELASRHAAFRKTFEWDRLSEPVQVVHAQADLDWTTLDWSHIDEENQPFEELLKEDRNRGFDLSRAPLMRFRLIKTSPRSHQLIWTRHHLTFDGWSVPIILEELIRLYNAFHRKTELSLDRPAEYSSYIEWLSRRDLDRAEPFWREILAGRVGPTAFHTERVNGPIETGMVRTRFSISLAKELAEQARRNRVTPSTLIQGAWAILLSRYSGEPDVTYGTAMSGRPADLARSDEIVGLFINTLPVRAEVPPATPASVWLRMLQDRLSRMQDYQDTPLVKVQQWSCVPRGTPLFEYIVVFENFPIKGSLLEAAKNSGLEITHHTDYESTNYPLALFCTIEQDVELRLSFDCRVFDGSFAQRALKHLRNVIIGLVSDGGAAIGALNLLTAQESHQVIVEWNDTGTKPPETPGIHSCFEAQVRLSPDAIAVETELGQLTYRTLNGQANRLARRLRACGVTEEAVTGICASQSSDIVVGLLAILKAGGAYLPLDRDYPGDRLALMMENSRARFLLTGGDIPETLFNEAVTRITIEGAGSLEPDIEDLGWSPDPDNLCYVIYTSGSTGAPKGVQVSHGAVMNLLTSIACDVGISSDDIFLSTTRISFDISALEIFLPLIKGARLALVSRELAQDATRLSAEINQLNPSLMQATPSGWKSLLDGGWEGADGLRALCGGEALSEDLARRLSERVGAVWNLYGPTETTIWSTRARLNQGPVSLGRPVFNTSVCVVDRCLHPSAAKITGEICIGGSGVSRGYLGAPDLTAERYIPDPFSGQPGSRLYQTGDFARINSDGAIQFIGREDAQVKIRGHRIEPREIEAHLEALPSVSDAVVLNIPDADGNNALAAYVVPSARHCEAIRRGSLDFSLVYCGVEALPSEEHRRRCRELISFTNQHRFGPAWIDAPDLLLSEFNNEPASARSSLRLRALSVGSQSRSGSPNIAAANCLPWDILVSPHGWFDERLALQVSQSSGQTIQQETNGRLEGAGAWPSQDGKAVKWINCGGDRDDFIRAGEMGANVTASLFTQTLDQAAGNIAAYRDALAVKGRRPESGRVAILMPAFLGEAGSPALERARGALLSAIGSQPLLKDRFSRNLSVAVDSELLQGIRDIDEFVGEYYLQSACLFGTVETSTRLVERLAGIGADEIVCFVDFGVTFDSAVAALPQLVKLKEILSKPSSPDPAALRAELRLKLPEHFIPSSFVYLDSLPRNSNGKIDRKKLASIAPSEPGLSTAFTAPSTRTEKLLAGIWSEVLDVKPVGVNDSFFDLGGHSLLAVKITSRVRELFSVDISLQRLFERPTISEMAREIDSFGENMPLDEGIPAIKPRAREKRRMSRTT